ncbi:MAG: TetR family transcriptional regulator [Alphaproteobacteria bacterium]|nr:TetR family transcriptional regulator [Alphaproteobacteria bacterium]
MLYEQMLRFTTRNSGRMAKAKKSGVSPRKMPAQDRSRATVELILDAAARILVKGGYNAFTTNRVAERAGVSVGSLYQYFPNKESLLGELMRRHVAELERGLAAITADAAKRPIADTVRALIEESVRAHLIDPELHRVLSEEVPHLGSLDWRHAYEARCTQRVREFLEARRSELSVTDLDLAIYLVTRTVETAVHDAVGHRAEDLRSGALAEELSRMITVYLTGKAPAVRRPLKVAAE